MKRSIAAAAFFTASLTVFFGLGVAYVELTERVCAAGGVCEDPTPLMVYPRIGAGMAPQPYWEYGSSFYEYGPRE
jgi:hypothetical protein